MIKTTLGQINQSWNALESLGSVPLPAGAFRRNLKKILDKCQREYQSYVAEFNGLLLEFSCKQLDNQTWERPKKEKDRIVFAERWDELQKVEVEINASPVTEQELEKYQIQLPTIHDLVLSKWLIVNPEEKEDFVNPKLVEEFPIEIDQQSEVAG